MILWANRLKPYYAFILRAVVLLLGVSLLSFSEVLERFDLVIYDKISIMQRYIPDNDVVIVAIDEESLQVLGRWPWSRTAARPHRTRCSSEQHLLLSHRAA